MNNIKLPYSEIEAEIEATPMIMPDSVIEITENGRYNVAKYSFADVNVEGGGSSDFSTATVTLTNPPQGGGTVEFEQSVYISVLGTMVGGGGGFTNIESSIPFVLYKGAGYANFPLKQNFAVTGDIEYDQEYGGLIIRGDGTLTIT